MDTSEVLLAMSVTAGLLTGAAAAQDAPPADAPDDEAADAAGPAADDESADSSAATPQPSRVPPVFVTARKWEEFLQDVPQSVSVVGGSTIEDSHITGVREASFLVPNLFFTEFSSRRLSFPTIRGISTGVGDPSVATYIDGAPLLSVSNSNLPMLDVERIEFLRGPQGTLYGRNTIGGLIHIITRRPTNDPEIQLGGSVGNYDFREFSLSYAGPIIEDELFVSISGMKSVRDGFTTNDITGNDVDDRDSLFGRGQIIWTPSDDSEFRFTLHGERARDGGFVLSSVEGLRDRPHRIAQDFEGVAERDIIAPSLTFSHFGENVDITFVSSFHDFDIFETADFDFSAIDGVRRQTEESQRSFSQEMRFSSPEDGIDFGDGASLKWLFGVHGFTIDADRSAATEFRPGGVGILFDALQVGTDRQAGEFDDTGFAVFTSATLTLFDRLDLGAGVRYDRETKDADLSRVFSTGGFDLPLLDASLDEEFDEVVPRFTIGYDLSDDVMLYGLAAKGFKAGGFNVGAPEGELAFGPETSWTYEAGIKTSWFDDRLLVNAAVFTIDWDDLQLSLFDPVTGGYIDNAGAATSAGFEIEAVARPVEWLDLFASFGLADAEFDEFTDNFGTDVAGNQLAFVPETTFNVGAQVGGAVNDGGRWFARAEYAHAGTYYFDAGNRDSDSYGLANFSVGVEWHNVRLSGWIRNAFDEEYILVAFQPSPADPNFFVGENGSPQTFGLSLSVKF
jgi:iron complex outermembrane receptor protein